MRLAELVGTLSIAADATAGVPDSHALRGAIVAARFAELLGVDDKTVHDAYYLPLLAMAGCSAESHTAASVLTDEVAFGAEIYGLDVGRASDVLPVVTRMARRGRGPLAGLIASARALGLVRLMKEVSRAHCEVAVHLAERFGFDESFRVALLQVFERWDGTGGPERTKGEELPLSLRIAQVAVDANVGHRLGGIEGAVVLTRERAGRGLDPSLVERFGPVATEACAGLESASPWNAAMNAEPAPHRIVAGAAVGEVIASMAHFADMKSRFTRAHSTGVAALASAAARRVGVSEEQRQCVHWAGLLHDIGRVAISATIWDKVEPLSDVEKERIRLHSYVGERILMRCTALSGVAAIATLAHERFDESGYHRRLPASALAPVARILAAADVYHALVETRPHRAAFSADRAAHELTQLAERGSLCPDAVRAVLGVENQSVRLPLRPSGLTDRELEVLRLIARGLTNKEIASVLDISVKTAGHHVQHVLEKLGVRTRAAATMLAMQQGLVTPGA